MEPEYFANLIKEITKLRTTEAARDLLLGLFTPAELEQMGLRLEIIRQLKNGIPQHEIASRLGVGVATVTRGSKMLHEGRFKNVK
jgi:TrpR family trp operon transcriptional repressor